MSFLTSGLVGKTTADGVNGITALGYNALDKITSTGVNNVGIGTRAGLNISTGTANTAVGYASLANVTTGLGSTAVGYTAGSLNTANLLTAIGFAACELNTTGEGNTGVGYRAIQTNSTGFYNTAVGFDALRLATLGGNTALGYQAGNSITTGFNLTLIGYTASPSSATAFNEVTLGNNTVATLRCQVTTITSISDARDKTNVKPLQAGLSFVDSLKPVRFTWNTRDGAKVGIDDTGFIAQDLQQTQIDHEVIPGLVYAENPEKLEAGYGKLIPILVKAIQELNEQVRSLQAALNAK